MNDFDNLKNTFDRLKIEYEIMTEQDVSDHDRFFGWGSFQGTFKTIKITDFPQYTTFYFDFYDKFLGFDIWDKRYSEDDS